MTDIEKIVAEARGRGIDIGFGRGLLVGAALLKVLEIILSAFK